jgi:hypothetical protein
MATNDEINALTQKLFEAHPDLTDVVKRLDLVGAIKSTGSLPNLIPPARDDSKLGDGLVTSLATLASVLAHMGFTKEKSIALIGTAMDASGVSGYEVRQVIGHVERLVTEMSGEQRHYPRGVKSDDPREANNK